MSKIKLTVPDVISTGKMVSFIAPCDCSNITCLHINGTDYIVVDAAGKDVTDAGNAWVKDALVTVSLYPASKKAYIQNSAHFAKKSSIISTNLTASGWTKASTDGVYYFFSYEISAQYGATADSIIEIVPRVQNRQQAEQYAALMLFGGSQVADDTNGNLIFTLFAYGTPNTVSIPIDIIIRGDS